MVDIYITNWCYKTENELFITKIGLPNCFVVTANTSFSSNLGQKCIELTVFFSVDEQYPDNNKTIILCVYCTVSHDTAPWTTIRVD